MKEISNRIIVHEPIETSKHQTSIPIVPSPNTPYKHLPYAMLQHNISPKNYQSFLCNLDGHRSIHVQKIPSNTHILIYPVVT